MELLLGIHLGGVGDGLLAGSSGTPVCRGSLAASRFRQEGRPFEVVDLHHLLEAIAGRAGLRRGELSSQCTHVFISATQGHLLDIRQKMVRYLDGEGFHSAWKGFGGEGEVSLWAGTGSGEGIAVSSDITTSAYGRTSAGEAVELGGWELGLSADGSAFSVGQAAVDAIIAGHEGRGEVCTALTDDVLRLADVSEINDLLIALQGTAQNHYRNSASSLVPAVVEAAELHYDPVAGAILQKAGEQLAAMVIAVRDRLGFGETGIPVVLSGPVILSSTRVFQVAEMRVSQVEPRAKMIRSQRPPVVGALLLAFRHRANQATPGLLGRLSEWLALSSGTPAAADETGS